MPFGRSRKNQDYENARSIAYTAPLFETLINATSTQNANAYTSDHIYFKTVFFVILYILLSLFYGFLTLIPLAIVRANVRILDESDQPSTLYMKLSRRILAHSERYLLLINVFHYVVALVTGALVSCMVFTERFADKGSSVYISVAVVLFCILTAMIASQIAKSIAFIAPEKILFVLSFPLTTLAKVFDPLLGVIRKVTRLLLTPFDVLPARERDFTIEAEDFGALAERSALAGKLEEEEGELIQGVVRFSDTLVQEVMTPRMDIVSIHIDASVKEAVEQFVEHGLSRLLVVGDELDEVHGILIAKDFIHLIGKNIEGEKLSVYVRDVFSVSIKQKIDDLLEDFQKNANHFAVVLDEHGGVSGVVTLEDVVEEIVGDIFDEYDSPEDEQDVEQISAREYILDGGTTVEDINSSHEFYIPEGEYDTIAGYVLSELEEIPEQGATFVGEGFKIEVIEVAVNRIIKVKITVR